MWQRIYAFVTVNIILTHHHHHHHYYYYCEWQSISCRPVFSASMIKEEKKKSRSISLSSQVSLTRKKAKNDSQMASELTIQQEYSSTVMTLTMRGARLFRWNRTFLQEQLVHLGKRGGKFLRLSCPSSSLTMMLEALSSLFLNYLSCLLHISGLPKLEHY